MKRIFLDCGANNGCSVRKFRETFKEANEYEIYSFEPNPYLGHHFHNLGVQFDSRAVWVKDEELDFYIVDNKSDGKEGGGSTLYKEKAEAHKNIQLHKIKIRGLNFSQWIKDNFNKKDEIILKMDIEGAEYKVLYKMIEDDTILYINKLYIEFHWEKIGLNKKEHNNLIKELKELKINKWDAMRW